MRTYVFVDAENHYWRTLPVLKGLTGFERTEEALGQVNIWSYGPSCYPSAIKGRRFGWDHRLLLFWDCMYIHFLVGEHASRTVERTVFVTACAGDDDAIHEARVAIRDVGFEPIVVREQKSMRDRRNKMRENHGRLDKPKGCDIALATRMVADAAANLFDRCCLFTSDADYLPAIEAVRRMGKVVIVGGYARALPPRSPYLHVPDKFVDLETHFKNELNNWRGDVEKGLAIVHGKPCNIKFP